ncbi:MAG: hypothetical protein UV60_C0004G0029 [Parcubacteria group bacterium GW2011_GWA2_43_11]|nr:MAG: hypothetical protein UU89_C0013G0004 [Parcubacteria group bacterium GW2011_GWC2_42_11]KKS85952.1 MAG: hypothetical protein UV60_C0004G0029 [Parcubacteria group bacterium GW2011_GWA2_43_11]
MNTVLFILTKCKNGKEQISIYSVPLEKYVPVAQYAYLEEGRSVPIQGHAVAFDGEGLRGIFSITAVYQGSGHVILPELGSKKTFGELDDIVNWYRVYIVYEPEFEEKVPLDAIPVMHPVLQMSFD